MLTLLTLPLVGLLTFGCAASSGEAATESATDAVNTAPAAPVSADDAAFDALTPARKKAFLFDERSTLRPDFTERSIRIVETIPAGPVREAALDAYFELRDHSDAYGGNAPDVKVIEKAGVTYAYSMAASGSHHSGSWGEHVVYDRKFDQEIVRFSYSE